MKFTVFGANGFIGSHLADHLKKNHFECSTPDIRSDNISDKSLGHVIYAVGNVEISGDASKMVDAHVCKLNQIISNSSYESLLYISSSRLYHNSSSTNEDSSMMINPLEQNELYNISKILGESLCLSSKKDNIRIVRPSNVIGVRAPKVLFLPSIIIDAITKNKIQLHSSLDSERDYIHINDLVKIIPEISLKGKNKIYNLAYGKNIKTKQVVDEISRITGCSIIVDENATKHSFPEINIERIKNEFNFKPSLFLDDLENIIKFYHES
jgi:nucleoside-diphosphate-sugar epimerase